jgi:predicted transcriptional regulator
MQNIVLQEIRNLHSQVSIPSAILMTLRGRREWKLGIKNRIGGRFPAPKGCLLMGEPGTGKTTIVNKIFCNLLGGTEIQENHLVNSQGELTAVYHRSMACATSAGIRDVLKHYQSCINIFDEIKIDRKSIHLFKQISNGFISWAKYGEINNVEFTGTLIGCANSIEVPRTTEISDLLATMDRFFVVECKSLNLSPERYFRATLKYLKDNDNNNTKVNWTILKEAIANDCFDDLSSKEKLYAEHLWVEKCRELLNVNQSLSRNVINIIDILTFIKRLLGVQDITDKKEIRLFCKTLCTDLIHFNLATLLNLTPAQKAIYELIKQKGGECTYQEISSNLCVAGSANVNRILNQLINLNILRRTQHGRYACILNKKEQLVRSEAMDGRSRDSQQETLLIDSL